MDFLNRATTQLTELYRSMTPGSRLTAGLLAAVVVLSVGYLSTHQASTPEVDLMHGVPIAASQLPAMEAAFAKANLKSYEIRGTSIHVPRDEAGAYMAALAAGNAVPPNFGAALREALSKDSPFASNKQRDQLIKIAIQDELSLWIRSMDGIETAYVLYDVDTQARLRSGQSDYGHGERQAGRHWATRRGPRVGHPASCGRGHRRTEARERHRLRPQRPHVVRRPARQRSRRRQPIHLLEAQLRARLEGEDSQRPVFHSQRDGGADRGVGSRAVRARAKPANRGISPAPRREPAESAPQPTADNAAGGNLATSLQANVAIGLRAVLGENRRDDDDPAQRCHPAAAPPSKASD